MTMGMFCGQMCRKTMGAGSVVLQGFIHSGGLQKGRENGIAIWIRMNPIVHKNYIE
ncbi:hypothetical protein SAMN05444972_110139 [Marininema halotolerans]|uniref:Uncharacterized protein n=1 Tax=Marininema halotolerans TaxID=1155944 RepID=A0A1I6TMD3_9BACL|nr:hypothetical protein SAMN05444972_110139 [Marininema halotolerans]